jgi:O-antigen ligase
LNKTVDEMSTAATAHGRQVKGKLASHLERIILGFLFLMVLSAPHSIAATQIAWSGAFLAWGLSFLFRPRPRLHRTPVDFPMLLFFILTIVSALFSYDPDVSIPLLRGAFLFTIVYLFAQNIRSRRVLRLLVLCLIASCMLNVIYTLGERAVGRGVKVEGLTTASPLFVAGIRDGDIMLEVDGRAVSNLNELHDALAATGATTDEPAHVQVYTYEWRRIIDVPRGRLLDGASAAERLGVGNWSRGRNWRAAGFYGHYTTYSEVLQLIASLAVGLFIAIPRKRSWQAALLAMVIMGQGVALLLTVTRASWLAFVVSTLVIILVGAGRRMALLAAACALIIIPASSLVLQQKRNVGFFDAKDGSTAYRETIWREGFALLTSKPRHLLVGVGMNSIIRHRHEWGLFDKGRLPIGHMHSTPLQLALERGVPALLVWLVLMFVYGRMLFRTARSPQLEGWIERGTALGALGGLIGFLASGIVHYNWGDSEVVMIFYIIMGITMVIKQKTEDRSQETE